MANYAIGDVQGCFFELKGLLDKINFDPAQDKLWFVGDLINRGPDSLRTIEFIYKIKDSGRSSGLIPKSMNSLGCRIFLQEVDIFFLLFENINLVSS